MRTSLRALTALALGVPLVVASVSPSLAAPKSKTDTAPPSVAVSAPASGSTVASSFTASGTASDNRTVAAVYVALDGGSWQVAAGTTSWSYPFSSVTGGSHTLAARAVDGSGNSSVASVSFSVATTSTVTTAPSPTPSPSATPSPTASPTPTATASPTPSPTSTSTTSTSSTAPNTQGSWVSPEGMTINVNTAGPWTIAKVYQLMLNASAGPGDFSRIAPSVTVNVQDTYSSATTTSVAGTAGAYRSFFADIYLQGVNSSFASTPDAVSTHEYGHAWTLFHFYIDHGGDWSQYLSTRWSSSDGSLLLGQDSRLWSSYTWDVHEIVADDYRLLFGDAAAISQSPNSLNPYIEPPAQQPGLRSWFLSTWM